MQKDVDRENEERTRAHGFKRERNGDITLFDPVGSVITLPGAINSDGLIVGGAADGNLIVRSVNGAITTFDVPDAGTLPARSKGPWRWAFHLLDLVRGTGSTQAWSATDLFDTRTARS
jgi:hypothetical protein